MDATGRILSWESRDLDEDTSTVGWFEIPDWSHYVVTTNIKWWALKTYTEKRPKNGS